MKNNKEILLAKLDEFIRKYYVNKLIKGVLLSLLFIVLYVLLVLYSEYIAFFSPNQKIFFILLGGICFFTFFILFILLPFLKYNSLGKRISYEKAVAIISSHFTNIDDKLINTLELSKLDDENNSLLKASIEQRISSLGLLSFTKAINFKNNYKYLKYLSIIVFIGLCVYFYQPRVYTDSVERMIKYGRTYEVPSAFQFEILNDNLEVVKGDNFKLEVLLKGDQIPEHVYLSYANNKYLLKNVSNNRYSYLFHNVNSTFKFRFQALSTLSKEYYLTMLSPPVLTNLSLKVISPSYTNLPVKTYTGVGDVSVAKGARIEWVISCLDADSLYLEFGKEKKILKSIKQDGKFLLTKRFLNSLDYNLSLSNKDIKKSEIAKYNIDVLPDIYPEINVSTIIDSLNPNIKYFKGTIRDDYGFSSLSFNYSLGNTIEKNIPIIIQKFSTSQEFYFSFDFTSLVYDSGSTLSYYFKVGDNDGVNGIKYSNTNIEKFYYPRADELFQEQEKIQNQLSQTFDESIKLNEEIRKDIKSLEESMISDNKTQWQKKEAVSAINDKRKQLDDLLKSINQQNAAKNKLQNTFNPQDSLFMQKQKQIDDLMNKLMDDELQKLMDEFNKLSKEFDKEKFKDLSDKMDMSYEDLDKQMQRNLDMLKKYDVELQFLSMAKRLDELAQKQEKLADNINKVNDKQKKLDDNTSDLNSIKNDFQELKKKNYSLRKAFRIPIMPQDFNKLDELQKESNNLMKENKSNKASGKLRHSAGKMKEMADDLRSSIEESNGDEVSVNIESLKKILNNLIQFSIDQEDLMYSLRKTSNNDPKYSEIVLVQSLQNDKYKSIQDSLYSLASKSPELAELLDNKIVNIKIKLKDIDEQLSERKSYFALRVQQDVMTTSNDLALLLADGLDNMKQSQQNSKDCKSGCKKPGSKPGKKPGSKPGDGKKGIGIKSLKEGQESLKKMMQRMINQMKNGAGDLQNKSNMKEMSQMLQKQEIYRNSIQKILNKASMGQQTEQILKEILKMLEKTETDISNFSIGKKTILRQEKILTKLLDAENAEQERDIDKKRESKTVKIHKIRNPRDIFKYKNKTNTYKDIQKNTNIKLNDYYRKLYLDYIIKLNNE